MRRQSYRESAERETTQIKTLCLRNAGSATSAVMASAGRGRASREAMVDARLQYDHFTGQVFTSVRPIAQTVAGLSIHVGRLVKRKHRESPRSAGNLGIKMPAYLAKNYSPAQMDILEDHEVLDAIRNPNEVHVEWSLKFVTMASLELTGRAFWWFPQRDDGSREIWPVPVHWLVPVQAGPSIAGWMLRPDSGIAEKFIPAEEIASFWYPHPKDPMAALSPLEAGAKEVLANEYIVDSQYLMFRNGIAPGYAVIIGDKTIRNGSKVKPKLTDPQRAEIRRAIMDRYGDVHNFNVPAILDGMIQDIKKITNSPHEMDYLNSSRASSGRVSRLFGTNPTITGENDVPNQAQAVVADKVFCSKVINPKLELLGQVMTKRVIPIFGGGDDLVLFFERAEPQDDGGEKVARIERAYGQGVATLNEYRTAIGLPSDEEGDVYFRSPMAMPIPAAIYKSGTPRLQYKSAMRVRRLSTSACDAFYKAYFSLWTRSAGKGEQSIKDAARAFLGAFKRSLVGSMGNARRRSSAEELIEDLVDRQKWLARLRRDIGPAIGRTAAVGAALELQAYGQFRGKVEIPQDAPAAAELIEKAGMPKISLDLPDDVIDGVGKFAIGIMEREYWEGIIDTVLKRVSRAIEQGILDGLTMGQIAESVSDDAFDGTILDSHAMLIARTECLPCDAFVDGALATAAYKRWYEGDMIEVVTDTGRKFTGTPNHPVLTLRGWVGLGDLTKDDSVICDGCGVKNPGSPGNDDVHTPPATIGEIFDSLAAVTVGSRERTGKPDFHGDGMDGYVDVLRPDRVLSVGSFSKIAESMIDGVLAPSDARHVLLAAYCAPFARDIPSDQRHRVAVTSYLEARSPNVASNGGFVCREFSGHVGDTFSGSVPGGDLLVVESSSALNGSYPGSLRHGSNIDASLLANGSDCTCIAPENLCDSTCGETGKIQVDSVRSLRRIKGWHGYVFNLTTVDGYFTANGIYTGNTTGAMNAGQHVAREKLYDEGIIEGKEWFATMDTATRDSHLEADGQRRAVDEEFELSSGEKCMYPGDAKLSAEERCRCRCVATATTVFSDSTSYRESILKHAPKCLVHSENDHA